MNNHDPKARPRADDPALAAGARRLKGTYLRWAPISGSWLIDSDDNAGGFARVIGSNWDLIGALMETMPHPKLVRGDVYYFVPSKPYSDDPACYFSDPDPLDAVLACCLAMERET